MRISRSRVSLLPAVAVAVFSIATLPVHAGTEDGKPTAAAKSTTAKPDREKKVYTNDDIDRMWPKQKGAVISARAATNPLAAASQAAVVRMQPLEPEKDPLWYAQQIAVLSAELDHLSAQEQLLRDFRTRHTGQDPGAGLRLNAPCEGFTTDNEIALLAQRRQEIEEQMASLEETAQQNSLPPGILRDAPAILAAAHQSLTPAEEQAALEERHLELANRLAATENELSGMSAQASAAGATLQPPTPGFGGNMTTDLIERLDNRAADLRSALQETEEAARQAGAPQL